MQHAVTAVLLYGYADVNATLFSGCLSTFIMSRDMNTTIDYVLISDPNSGS